MEFPPRVEFPNNYTIGATHDIINSNWPKLQEEVNFRFTSLRKTGYTCLAYAVRDAEIQIDMLAFSKRFDLTKVGLKNDQPLDHIINAYKKLFEAFYNFEECDNSYEEGFEKIALYEGMDEDGDIGFLHVALQIDEVLWTSKLGHLEDIAHTLDSLNSNYYGKPVLFMKRASNTTIKLFNDEE